MRGKVHWEKADMTAMAAIPQRPWERNRPDKRCRLPNESSNRGGEKKNQFGDFAFVWEMTLS
jgi:hypothetical protein